MFYDQLIYLCKIHGEKITPLIKKLNLSSGNIKRWKEGTNPNSEIVKKFAEYFGVSTDFLLQQDNETTSNTSQNTSAVYIAGSDGTHKFSSIDKEKVDSFLAKHPVRQPSITPQYQELVELWEQLDPIEQAELKGLMKGYIKSKKRTK